MLETFNISQQRAKAQVESPQHLGFLTQCDAGVICQLQHTIVRQVTPCAAFLTSLQWLKFKCVNLGSRAKRPPDSSVSAVQ